MQQLRRILILISLLAWPFFILAQTISTSLTNQITLPTSVTSTDSWLNLSANQPSSIIINSAVSDSVNLPTSSAAEIVSSLYTYQSDASNSVITIKFWLDPLQTNDFHKRSVYLSSLDDNKWSELSTYTDFANGFVWATTTKQSGQLLIGSSQKVWEGEASWYSYKKCPCAAFKFAPKNAILKVTNLQKTKNFGKIKYVKVNDYGPEDKTNRVIDLDKVAFAAISQTGAGLINVKVELVTDPKELKLAKKTLITSTVAKTKK